MGHSKATKAQRANLSKASSNSHRLTVEEILDSDDDGKYLLKTRWNHTVDGLFFFVEDYFDFDLDLNLVSDLDLEERDLEDEENEIIDDVVLLTFTYVFWKAQEIAVEKENKKWGERKRPKRYTKTSVCTKQHHVQRH